MAQNNFAKTNNYFFATDENKKVLRNAKNSSAKKLIASITQSILHQKTIMQLSVKRVSPNATMPTYGSKSAAGIDLCACETITVFPRTRAVIDTGLSFEWDDDTYYGRIAPRSGLSVKQNIDIGAGVIDFDYRGNIKVCFINNGDNPYTVTSGDKVAQIVFEKVAKCVIVEVDALGETSRGSGGFGSTGK